MPMTYNTIFLLTVMTRPLALLLFLQLWILFTLGSLQGLSANPSKTEFLIIGTPQQRSKLTVTILTFLQGILLEHEI